VLGRYELLAELGAGGMATVYRARDRELRREVAVKVLHPHMARRREAVARFHREARATAGLDHPGVLAVFDVGGGEAGPGGAIDPPYQVLELVAGPSLAELVTGRGPLIAEQVAAIGALVAEALAVAHAAGIVHRDVKPANVLADGRRLVLGDFGVAQVSEQDSVDTRTGAVLGTPAFMSPEQASGEPLDARSDLYSLGATLYQLATGALPVAGNPARAVAAILAGDVAPVERRNPSAGGELSRAIGALMSREPAGRPASAAEAAGRLAAIAGEVGEPAALVGDWLEDPAAAAVALRPRVFSRTIERAREASRRGERVRAAALIERALALEPESSEARALAARLARGERGRRAVALLACAALVAAVAVAAATMLMKGRSGAAESDAGTAISEGGHAGGTRSPPANAVALETGARPATDAGTATTTTAPSTSDAGGGRGRVRPAPVAIDAGMAVAIDAAATVVVAVPEAPARLTLVMAQWCDVTIGGVSHGRADARRAIELPAGRHEVVCSQGEGLGRFATTVELAAGEARTVRGDPLGKVALGFALAAGEVVAIDGVGRFVDGGQARVAARTYRMELERDGRPAGAGYVTVSRPCTIKARPRLACY
jgi:eukaryotic-like serine/threonine-protein kinase